MSPRIYGLTAVEREGILTPAAGRATQKLPGPRVVDGVLPAGRALLVGRFILGARHGDSFFFFSSPPFFFFWVVVVVGFFFLVVLV